MVAGLIGVAVLGQGAPAGASGFQMLQQSTSSIGNAVAGGAAAADDASTLFFNPAGLTRLPRRQGVVTGHLVMPSVRFHDLASAAPPGRAPGNDGGDAGNRAVLPNFYLAAAVSDDLRVGIGFFVPFAVRTTYDAGWVGRFQTTRSEIRSVTVQPALAYRITPALSVGAGVQFQRTEATLANFVYRGAAPDAHAQVTGSDRGAAVSAGLLWQATPRTRLGVAWRGGVDHELTGTVRLTLNDAGGALLMQAPATTRLRLPSALSLSLFHRLDDRWDLMADATWTQWSRFDRLLILRPDTGAIVSDTVHDWRDTLRFSLGANYRWDDRWMLRTGVMHDPTPIADAYRTARIPDADRTWLAVGARYAWSRAIAVEAGYARVLFREAAIRDVRTAQVPPAGSVVGRYTGGVHVFSAQLSYTFE
jgi:long-chain fatty acid transport protein